jgi:hypothetical protein
MEDQDQIDLLAEHVKSLPYESLVELEQGPKALPIADNYRQIIAQAGPQIQAITQKQYQPSPELTGRISEAKSAYEKADQPQEQDMLSQAITSFMPAILGGLSGESGKIAQAPASKQARDLYEAQRKEQAAYKEKDKERALKRYDELVKSKQSEREAFDKAGQREIEGIKAGAQGAKDLASLDMRGAASSRRVKNGPSGGRGLTAAAAEGLSASDAAISSLEDARSLSQNNPEMFGKGVGILGSISAATGIGDTATKAASIDADLMTKAQTIGRYLEGGKLAEGDIKRYSKMLPQRGDKPEIVDNKIKTLERLIQQKYNSELSGYKSAGFDTSGMEPKEISKGLTEGVGKNKQPKEQTKEWNGKTYKLIGDEWVAQ